MWSWSALATCHLAWCPSRYRSPFLLLLRSLTHPHVPWRSHHAPGHAPAELSISTAAPHAFAGRVQIMSTGPCPAPNIEPGCCHTHPLLQSRAGPACDAESSPQAWQQSQQRTSMAKLIHCCCCGTQREAACPVITSGFQYGVVLPKPKCAACAGGCVQGLCALRGAALLPGGPGELHRPAGVCRQPCQHQRYRPDLPGGGSYHHLRPQRPHQHPVSHSALWPRTCGEQYVEALHGSAAIVCSPATGSSWQPLSFPAPDPKSAACQQYLFVCEADLGPFMYRLRLPKLAVPCLSLGMGV